MQVGATEMGWGNRLWRCLPTEGNIVPRLYLMITVGTYVFFGHIRVVSLLTEILQLLHVNSGCPGEGNHEGYDGDEPWCSASHTVNTPGFCELGF